jgi:hypothetical protein
MKKEQKAQTMEQPEPFTPGITKGMVRQRAYELYRDKLDRESLSIEDWVLAEKDLVQGLQTDGLNR